MGWRVVLQPDESAIVLATKTKMPSDCMCERIPASGDEWPRPQCRFYRAKRSAGINQNNPNSRHNCFILLILALGRFVLLGLEGVQILRLQALSFGFQPSDLVFISPALLLFQQGQVKVGRTTGGRGDQSL